MDASDEPETAEPIEKKEDLSRLGAQWMERIRASEKRESNFRDDAEAAEKAYACDASKDKGELYDFNIHFSNVETIVPAIYNSTPVPDIRRRFVEAIGEEPAPPKPQAAPQQQQAVQRPLPGMPPQAPQQPQPNPVEMERFKAAMQEWQAKKQADKDAKDFGDMLERAIAAQIDDNRLDKEIEANATDAFNAGRGIVRLRLFLDDYGGEERQAVGYEAVSWRDFRMGPAKRWNHVPWVAYLIILSKETAEEFQDEELLAQQKDDVAVQTTEDADEDLRVWEIWDKPRRRVLFIREHDEKVIKRVDDPLGLKDFFPQPEPVQPICLTGKLTPVVPFSIYKKLADELDTTTKRINRIIKGLKVRGAFVGGGQGIEAVQNLDDWQLAPLNDMEQLSQVGGGFEKAISWWPIDKAIAVVIQLSDHREKIKQAIFELTGISDIIRGQSMASETATAQEIKTQWGALRIQKMQRLIARQVRDVFCLSAEIITKHFSEETLYAMTGIKMTDGMRMLMQRPVYAWYRVDVESDSTVRADMTRVKGEMAEFLNGTAQFFGVVGPLAKEQPQLAEPMAEIYASFARVFRLGKQAEDAVERLADMARKAAKSKQSDPEQEIEKQRLMAEVKDMQQKRGIEIENLKLTGQKLQNEVGISAAELQIKTRDADRQDRDADRQDRQQVIDTIHDEQELQIEREQKRAALIGN